MRPTLLLAATLALVAGCAEPDPPALQVRALYLEPMYDGAAIRVNHEAVPDVMPAMEMPLSLAYPDLIEGLTVGTPILLTLDSASFRVIDVEQLPEGTVLDLDPENDDAFVPGQPED